MAQPGTDQHEGGVSVRETAHHTGAAADFPVKPFNDITVKWQTMRRSRLPAVQKVGKHFCGPPRGCTKMYVVKGECEISPNTT